MTEVSFPTCDKYMECLQSGSGIPVYSGTILQRGYGVRGLFRRLASGLLPLLQRIGKAVASTAKRRTRTVNKRIRKSDVFGSI